MAAAIRRLLGEARSPACALRCALPCPAHYRASAPLAPPPTARPRSGGTGWASSNRAPPHRRCHQAAASLPALVPAPCGVPKELQDVLCPRAAQFPGLLPHLATVPAEQLLDTSSYLTQRDIQKQQLLRLPWILLRDKGSIQMRLAVLLGGETMFESAAHGLAFCQFALPKIRSFRSSFHVERLKLPHHRNRVYFMADKLGVTVPEMTEAVSRIRGFGAIPLQHIVDVTEQLATLDLPSEKVLSDPWIFLESISLSNRSVQEFAALYYSQDETTGCPRFAVCSASGASPFEEDSLVPFIANLNLGGNAVALQRARDVMSSLLWEGYTIVEILQNPRVLNHSVKRISERLSLLRAAGLPKVFMAFLYGPQSRFDACFATLVRDSEARATLLCRTSARSNPITTLDQALLAKSHSKHLAAREEQIPINLQQPPR